MAVRSRGFDERHSMDDDVQRLVAESEIRRVLLSYCRGVDRVDLEMIRDCYWPDAVDRHGPFSGTRDEFVTFLTTLLPRHTMTMHHVGNTLIEFDDSDEGTACAETYAVGYHSGEPPGDIRWNYAAGFRYVDRFERRNGLWKFAARTTVIEWATPWDADRQRLAAFGEFLPRRDAGDPCYQGGRR
jgi:hypothetical protein